MAIQHESEKYSEKHGSGVIFVYLHKGPRTKMDCSLVTHYPQITVFMSNVQNVHCCASGTVVMPLVCLAALYFRLNTD